MGVYKGILSFPSIFRASVPKGSDTPKYSLALMFPPGDPEAARLKQEFEQLKLNAYPSGMPNNANACFMNYRDKYFGKDYYDPALDAWDVFTCTADETQKPTVVDMSYQPVVDPGDVRAAPGMVVYVDAGMSAYRKGTGGIGGWLNGVMVTGEEGQLGRLDNKRTAEQMFGSVVASPGAPGGAPAAAPAAAAAPPQAPAAAPAPTPAPAPAPAPAAAGCPLGAPAGFMMTAAAKNAPYQDFMSKGWTNETLISNGYMIATTV